MSNFVNMDIFSNYQKHIDKEQEIRENIRIVVREIEQLSKEATITLQVMHADLSKIPNACALARKQIAACAEKYEKLAALLPTGQYYRYSDHWTYITQRLVFLCALVVYLETGSLMNRETAAEMLGLKVRQADGFQLDIEDYLLGVLMLASELSRFATNSVTMGDYDRPLNISHFIGELNTGFRVLNMKNDGLRKRFDALKYDVKKIEEVVYDVSIRGLSKEQQKLQKEQKAEKTN
ncbi:trsn [Drosophila busckii]|uniref:Translin n=1 Tax=Drosophila busckii TaxID=30019 RepID=A0A0M5J5R7_DROBS|nr:translin [Drosophila busckii]ALC48218.1 trsn [Drosophila busckii]